MIGTMLNIESPNQHYKNALWHLGFRPFFIGAALFALLSMLLWLGSTTFNMLPLATHRLLPVQWHGHEMIYGYSLAVIAGFLLTAVRNWTNVDTVNGPMLAVLSVLWLLARVMPFVPFDIHLWLMALFDIAFQCGLLIAVLVPILKVRQWRQLGIVFILLLLLVGNVLFYVSVLSSSGLSWRLATLIGLYGVLAMILLMARRVVPFFIEKGVGYPVQLKNSLWLDSFIFVIFVLFAINQLKVLPVDLAPWLALTLAILNIIRLAMWHTPGIWRKPLLWSLYLAYVFIVIGFVLSVFATLLSTIALHAFAVGGVGLMTIGMMSRVALGHTGRNVFDPPRILVPIFTLVLLGAVARVLLPLFDMQHYPAWLLVAQMCWIIAFGLFAWVYVPMLYQPRVDGRYG